MIGSSPSIAVASSIWQQIKSTRSVFNDHLWTFQLLPEVDDVNMEVEEDEEDDIDFNPFLRGDSPSEASSSLNSENEGPGGAPSRPREETQVGKDEGNLMQATVIKRKETTPSIEQGGDRVTSDEVNNKDLSSRDETPRSPPVLEIDNDDEDAICMRTRARHSLANYTLEELETFLQESDDDGDPPNVDDEKEYRKFLAAVLVGGTTDEKEGQVDEILDEDEDNDVDFELEIEEALESDEDENVDYGNRGKDGKQKGGDAHVPVTRHKKRLKESGRNKKTLLGQAKKPLCPLMPYESSAQTPVFPAYGSGSSFPNIFPHSPSSVYSRASVITGFTAHQIGQLYVLIHEHTQFLIQVFSISVLDPSKQQVASGVQKMISEMICRREEALGQRKAPYPEFLFHRPNLRSSLTFDPHQAVDSSDWTPLIDNPVLSILDVAPLRLVKSFMTDVSDTVWRHRRSHIDDESFQSHLIREPLFPLPASEDSSDIDKDISAGATTLHSNAHSAVQASPAQVHKKSLASTLVEGTKKQSAALVPKDIARSAQRFYILFNAAHFPRKPPLPAVVNRVLFTDAEDGLLAMGIMQYNNDWAAIQQHFLPCKSTHQIFVRQKNRSSSNAPENPIKAVRRMKSSPLTIDEKACICEGLKLFRNDWLSVWKFIVPYRDPSLLPRLWRIATGTQKSYRKTEAMKEKRRLYEAKRRKMKALMDGCHTSSHKEGNQVDNGRDNSAGDVDGDDEAYVHEAFMEDLEPRDVSLLSINRCGIQSHNIMAYNSSTIRESFQHSSHQDFHPHESTRQLTYNSISRAFNSQTSGSKGVKVVKLAPDLPPVNLPPSVRVISQSALQNYHCGLSASTVSDNAAKVHVPRVSQTANVGSGILNPGEHLNKISDNGLDTRRQQDDNTHASQFGAEENTSESDLQMHPLLFQAPRDQLSSYFSSNSHATGSAIHNYLPRDLQSNPNLFRPQISLGFSSNVTEQPEKAPSDLPTIDFHPLLQRSDSGNGDSSTRPSLYWKSGESKTSQEIFDKLFDRSDCNLRIPMLGNNQVATRTTSLTHNVKESNLDLDISLGSAPDKEKALGREYHNVAETPTLLEQRTVGKNLRGDSSFHYCSNRCPEATTTGNLSWHILPPNKCGGFRRLGDHDSITGIVMEQEELSDSEEEIEHVEFEREEIDDSEEDKLVSEQPTGIQNKEFAFFSSKGEEIQAARSLQSRHLKKGLVDKPKRDQPQQGRSSKRQSLELSKMHPLLASKSKATPASRKPRKRSF